MSIWSFLAIAMHMLACFTAGLHDGLHAKRGIPIPHQPQGAAYVLYDLVAAAFLYATGDLSPLSCILIPGLIHWVFFDFGYNLGAKKPVLYAGGIDEEEDSYTERILFWLYGITKIKPHIWLLISKLLVLAVIILSS